MRFASWWRRCSEPVAVFVHLTSHRHVAAIRRGGIRPVKTGRFRPLGVYAMPVTRNFSIAHQWLRELKRLGGGTIMGVYFRIPDDQLIEISHYNSAGVTMTAAEAAGLIFAIENNDPVQARAADAARRKKPALPSSPEGYQVIIPRAIAPAEILRVKALPQIVGWRYRPGANGTVPCICVCCERGSFGVRKLERRVEADEAAGRKSSVTMFGREDASYARVERMKRARRD